MEPPLSTATAVLNAIAEARYDDAIALLRPGVDLDDPCDEGATLLFSAVLSGHLRLVEAILQGGADPNFQAGEPASIHYAPKPLDLAMQARFLMDWDKFHPIVELLQRHGAIDSDGATELSNLGATEGRARTLQAARRPPT